MMAQKRLDELLKEDQEPFQLKSYIADRRTKLRPSSRTHLQKRKPISHSPNFPGIFCSLFSSHASPDLTKSAAKSPCRSPIFLHIPARTTALRIQKHSKTIRTPKSHGFGLLGSIWKRLTNRGRNKEIESAKVSVKDILRWDSSEVVLDHKSGRYSCNVSTPSSCSAFWSQEDLETSSSGQSDQDSTHIFASKHIDTLGDYGYCETPFRFVLQRTPSGHRTPEFLSPAASPRRTKTEEKDKLEDGGAKEEEEQCSPVSVLDAPFEEEDYAIVQRARQQQLKKLQRLDPIELEKRMVESDKEDDDIGVECSDFHQDREIPKHMRLLVSDLIAEEEKGQKLRDEDEEVMKRVVKRVETWEDVEANTIDMMVEQDFKREFGEWNRNQQQVKDTAAELELAIFGLLVQELWS